MLRILRVIGGNALGERATVRLPGSVPTPVGFRGRVSMDPSRCVACGVCAYVCVSGAIHGREGRDGYVWSYEPGQCAFCARCHERCAGRAISMEASAAAVYHRPGEQRVEHQVAFPPCVDCGAPRRPAPAEFLSRALPHVGEEAKELAQRCERCRRRLMQRRMAVAAGLILPAKGGGPS